jgi:periplasmic divalent cation tolerance protein
VVGGKRKVACVNIVPKVSSLFRWKGKIEEAEESLMVVKTRAELFPDIVSTVKSIHSYEVPEIIALPIVEGNPTGQRT